MYLDMADMEVSEQHPSSSSKFHWLFLSEVAAPTALYNTVVEETQNFVVLPTKGSIVPYWVLIVPKFAIPRMSDVPEVMKGELSDLVKRVSSKLQADSGTIYTFEHGGFQGSSVSCGVDQAHLHIALLDFDLIEAAKTASPGGWKQLDNVRLPQSEIFQEEYWFVSNGEITICKPIDIPRSQFFRRVIAEAAGEESLWDYRTEDFMDNVASTVKTMSANGY